MKVNEIVFEQSWYSVSLISHDYERIQLYCETNKYMCTLMRCVQQSYQDKIDVRRWADISYGVVIYSSGVKIYATCWIFVSYGVVTRQTPITLVKYLQIKNTQKAQTPTKAVCRPGFGRNPEIDIYLIQKSWRYVFSQFYSPVVKRGFQISGVASFNADTLWAFLSVSTVDLELDFFVVLVHCRNPYNFLCIRPSQKDCSVCSVFNLYWLNCHFICRTINLLFPEREVTHPSRGYLYAFARDHIRRKTFQTCKYTIYISVRLWRRVHAFLFKDFPPKITLFLSVFNLA